MNKNNLIPYDRAVQIMKEHGGKCGCRDFNSFCMRYGDLNNLSKMRFECKEWDISYIEAVLSLGEHYGCNKPDRRTVWTSVVECLTCEIKYRNSVDAKKATLRKMAEAEVRGADEDALEKKRNARVQTDTLVGSIGASKKQKRINEERLQHIHALEKTLEKGGSLREVCDELYKDHNDCIENLPTNEETAKTVMQDKRKCAFKALILSWFIMPIYILVRAIDILCDSVIVAKIKNDDLDSRFSLHAPIMGRLTIPYVLCGALTAIETADTLTHGGEIMYGSIGYHIFFTFLETLFVFTVAKSLIGVPAAYLADFIGKAVEWASDRFDPIDEYTAQFGAVEFTAVSYNHFKGLFDERQAVIRELRTAIKENRPRYEIDTLRIRGAFSYKSLEKEKETFAKIRKEK